MKTSAIRLKELDVLRGFAAINVLIYHFTTRYGERFGDEVPFKWPYGNYGVELFFIISGFVIFMSLHNVSSIKEFAYKRAIRLYPAYWICLIITFAAISIFKLPGTEASLFEAAVNLTMIQRLFNVENVDGVYWSLLPELLFYVMMGLLFKFKLLHKVKLIGLVWLTLILLNYFLKLPLVTIPLNLKYGMYFYAGIIFYKIYFDPPNWTNHLHILACYLISFTINPSLEFIIVDTLIFAVFYLFVYGKLKVISLKPLIFFGTISYPLYLIHQSIGFIFMRHLRPFMVSELTLLFTIAVSILLAWVIMTYLERPFQSRIKKLIPLNPAGSKNAIIEQELLEPISEVDNIKPI